LPTFIRIILRHQRTKRTQIRKSFVKRFQRKVPFLDGFAPTQCILPSRLGVVTESKNLYKTTHLEHYGVFPNRIGTKNDKKMTKKKQCF
jgi:hypothetical protein